MVCQQIIEEQEDKGNRDKCLSVTNASMILSSMKFVITKKSVKVELDC